MTNAVETERARESTETKIDSERKAQLLEAAERLEGHDLFSVSSYAENLLKSKEQRSAGAIVDPPEFDKACDGLKRLAKRFPKEVSQILDMDNDRATGDVCCEIYGKLNQDMSKHGYTMIADVAEFIEGWEEAETRKRNARATLKATQPFAEQWQPDTVTEATADQDDGKIYVDNLSWRKWRIREEINEIKLVVDTVQTANKLLYSRAEPTESLGMPSQECMATAGLLTSAQNRLHGLCEEKKHESKALNRLSQIERDAWVAKRTADENSAATTNLNDIREQVRRITGLVEAAHLCEGSITHGSGDKDAIEDFFTAISGSISVAASKCRQLLADLDAKGGAS